MRFSAFTTGFILLCTHTLTAQDLRETGRIIDKGIYRLPAFREGKIYFKTGAVLPVKLNYDITMDEMHFISGTGDTLAVADPATISTINIDSLRFYYDHGYLQMISTGGPVVLAFKQELFEQTDKKGAFGISTTHPGAVSYNYFSVRGQHLGKDNESVQLDATERYFFGDSYGNFLKASRSYLLNHFVKKQEEIKSFLKTNHTDFNKEKDLLKLLQYCAQL